MDLQNPHDSYFKSVFSKKENLIPFLEKVLPQEVFSCINIDSIKIETNSYIDNNLNEFYSDLSISCLFNDCSTNIYILVEHKSYYDKYALLQIFTYMNQIWNKESKDKNTKFLRPIIPVLFCHYKGKEPFNRFSQLFGNKYPNVLKQYRVDYMCEVFNLVTTPDEQLESTAKVKLGLYALKYSRTALEKVLQIIVDILKSMVSSKENSFDIKQAIIYVLSCSGLTEEEFFNTIDEMTIASNIKEVVMNTAQLLIQKGKVEGKLEGEQIGIQKEKIEIAKSLKQNGVDIKIIALSSGLTEEAINKL